MDGKAAAAAVGCQAHVGNGLQAGVQRVSSDDMAE